MAIDMNIDPNCFLTFGAFQKDVERTMMKDGDDKYYTIGLAGEVGEVSEIVKKALYHGHPLDETMLKKELGDVMFYVAALASYYGISLGEIARVNIHKRAVRYPEGFNSQNSINKDETRE